MRPDKYVFLFVCTKCKRKHYSLTNTLAPFVNKEHQQRYFCKGELKPKGSEVTHANGNERKVS